MGQEVVLQSLSCCEQICVCADDQRSETAVICVHVTSYRLACESTYLLFIIDKLNVSMSYLQQKVHQAFNWNNLNHRNHRSIFRKVSISSFSRFFLSEIVVDHPLSCVALAFWVCWLFICFHSSREFILIKLSRVVVLSSDCGWTPTSVKLNCAQFYSVFQLNNL